MRTNNRNRHKNPGNDSVVQLANRTEIEVAHYFISDNERLVALYLSNKQGGINLNIPFESVAAIVQSESGRDVLQNGEWIDNIDVVVEDDAR